MNRIAAPVAALAAALVAVAAAPAGAAVYRGAGVDDPAMPVKLKLSGSDVIFEYSDVLTGCSDGSEPRQGGASHSDHLNDRRRFKDRLHLEDTASAPVGDRVGAASMITSVVKGKVRHKRATGTLTYDLVYEGGACHSGEIEWKAKRK